MKRFFAILLFLTLTVFTAAPALADPAEADPTTDASSSTESGNDPSSSDTDNTDPESGEPSTSEPSSSDQSDTEPTTEPSTSEPIREYTLAVLFLDENGNEVSPKRLYIYKVGESYSVTPPPKNGYTPEPAVIRGVMESRSMTVTVTYKKNSEPEPQPEPGIWTISGDSIQYIDGGNPVKGNATIDGKAYKFDGNGNLIHNGFFSFDGKTVYLDNSKLAHGYKIIDGSLYCFDSKGLMINNTTYDGHSFDISGRVTDENVIIKVGSKSYMIQSHVLYQGYYLLGENIVYFGNDYAMVTGAENTDGCVFDATGALTSGIKASALSASGLKNAPYTGEPCTPEFTVKFAGITLTENVHYTVSYTNNTSPGIATVTVTGMGIVEGSIDFHFSILSNNTKKLTIKYRNEAGMSVAPTYENSFEPGQEYKVESPEIKGYVPDKEIIEGVMGNEKLELVVIYSKAEGDSSGNAGVVSDDNQGSAEPKVETKTETIEAPEPKYNLKLFFIIFGVSTVLIGGSIALIINWDLIKAKAFSPRKKKKI